MVIRSNFRLGNKFLQHINLGINTGIFIYLENTKMYPLTKSITPATIVCNSLVYTGSNQTAQITSVTLDGDTLIEGTDYIISTNNGGIDVGTYNVTIQGIGDYVDTSTSTFDITPAVGNASVSGVSLTYNGQSRDLITVNNNTGTMHYRVGTDGTWSTTIPTATDTGSWTIYYYMDASLNYTAKGSSSSPWGSVSSSIEKADQEAPTAYGSTVTYGSTANAAFSGGGGHGSIEWSNGNSRSALGSQITSVRWTGDSNYNESQWSNAVTLTVNKISQSAPNVSGSTTTYPTTATASASGGGGQGSIEWESAQSQTSVGSHITRARWSGNAIYNASPWSGYVTVQMNKADQSAPTAYGATVDYGYTASASASGGGGQGSIEWSNGNSRSAMGSQTTYARWSGNGNYNPSPWSNAATLTVSKANQSAPTATGSSVSEGSTATASASGGGGHGSIEWSNGNTRTAVGSQTTRARWSGDDYYNASDWSNEVTLTVTQSSTPDDPDPEPDSYYVVVAVTNNTGKTSPAVSALASDGTYLVQLCGRQNGNFTTTPTVVSSGTVRKINVNENGGYIGYITITFRGNTIMAKQYIGMQSNITNISLTRTFELEDAKDGSNTIYITFEDS